MKVSHTIQHSVSKIVKKQRFVKDILTSIFDHGGKVLLVGGAVRDVLLQKDAKDLDFEVYGLTLDQLEQILKNYGPVSLIGKSFGVLRLHGVDVDWSLPRKDSSGRHPTVAYDPFMSYQDAFIRRDITINAMGIDMQSLELVDLYGGLQDLQNKILRAPDLNFFVQDPLRLLRVMQFVGRFEMSVDERLSDACKTVDLSSVSQERIEQEFSKLFLQSARPSIGLQWLVEIGRFHDFFPGIELDTKLIAMIDHAAQQNYRSEQNKLACLWAIMVGSLPIYSTKNVIEFARATNQHKHVAINFMKKLTRHQRIVDRVTDLVWYEQIIGSSLTNAQIKWLAYWLSPDCSLRLLLQYAALKNDQKKIDILFERAEKLEILDAPVEPLLTGKDFLDIAQGAELGKLVKQAYQIQIDQGIVDGSVLKSLVLED